MNFFYLFRSLTCSQIETNKKYQIGIARISYIGIDEIRKGFLLRIYDQSYCKSNDMCKFLRNPYALQCNTSEHNQLDFFQSVKLCLWGFCSSSLMQKNGMECVEV